MIGASLKCREPFRVDGRRSDDQFQVGPLRQQLLQVAQQEVDVQRTLMRLVDDDRVVGVEERSPWVSASRMPSVITLISPSGRL